jgi:hypothetical protein
MGKNLLMEPKEMTSPRGKDPNKVRKNISIVTTNPLDRDSITS